jgi:hypothetical protein
MEYVLDGYCGVYCGACPALLATKAGKIDAARQCCGCKSDKPTGFCATCGIKACAQSKGYEFCGQCSQLVTCELMQKFVADTQYPYGQCVLKNMQVIQEEGLAKWLETQDTRWRCQNCGAAHSWYQQNCPQCSQAVANYQADI